MKSGHPRGDYVKFTPDMIRMVFRMRLVEQKSMQATADRVGVDYKTLVKFCRLRGLPRRVRRHTNLDWNFSLPQLQGGDPSHGKL